MCARISYNPIKSLIKYIANKHVDKPDYLHVINISNKCPIKQKC